MIDDQYVYLIANLPLLIIWAVLYFNRKDLRKEMRIMSILIGLLSVATSYYWWTHDWWRPATMTGTKVGIEDFLTGFSSGGIMAVVYEEVFKKRHYKRKLSHHYPGGGSLLLILAMLMSFLFYVAGLTSFIASTIAMTCVAFLMYYFRKDLFYSGVISGLLMMIISMPIYYFINFLSTTWVDSTYLFDTLTGIKVSGIPMEEFVFWFLAGFLFGPFYEYWQGERLRKISVKV